MPGIIEHCARDGNGLAASGTTGNNTHASRGLNPGADKVAVVVVVEAVGGTPTVTYKVQAALDNDKVADGSANWFDIQLLPAGSDTSLTSDTKTAVGAYVYYVSLSQIRFARRVRLVTSLNTNVTYHADLHQQYAH